MSKGSQLLHYSVLFKTRSTLGKGFRTFVLDTSPYVTSSKASTRAKCLVTHYLDKFCSNYTCVQGTVDYINTFSTESQNRPITESQNHPSYNHRMFWIGSDLKAQRVPTLLSWAEILHIRSDCPEPHPTWT